MTFHTIPQRRIVRYLAATACLTLTVFVLAATWLIATAPDKTDASSHREAPLISQDPTVDNLDVYAFVSPDAKDTVTLIATWIPFEEPGGGPNFYHFDPNARYLINIDQDGDAVQDIIYEWTFSRPTPQNDATFLYNTGPIGPDYAADPDFNLRQMYTVTKIIDPLGTPTEEFQTGPFVMVPDNVGPRSTPNYEAIAANAVRDSGDGLPTGYKEFTGQRDDPFFVDVRSVFDLLGLRPFNALHAISLPVQQGQDVLEGFNTHATAIQVPISELVSADCDGQATDTDCVIGVWSTAERRSTITYAGGAATGSGDFVQVSRLGNPLVNEVVIDLARKDAFNSLSPTADAIALDRVFEPEVAKLMNQLYGGALQPIQEGSRTDIVTIFLTGIPTVNQQTNSGLAAGKIPSEQLRLNTAIKPTQDVCQGDPLGLFNDPATGPTDLGDLTAFPNGRRLEDDVTDIALRSVAQGYGSFLATTFGGTVPEFQNLSPNNQLGDGVDANDVPCLSAFPYMGAPHSGYENNHKSFPTTFLPTIKKAQ